MVSSWSLHRLTVMIGVSLLAAPAADAHDKDGPVISPSQSEIILQYGQNYKLTCTSDRPIQFLQQSPPEESGTSLFRKEYRNLSSSDGSEYRVELELLHVDRDAVGYYACFDGSVAGAAALAELTAEPPDTENVTYIYVFVNETRMFAPMRGFVVAKNNSKFVVECRPTTPDISVNISLFTQDRTPPNVKYSKKIGFIFSKIPKDKDYICTARRGNQTTMVTIHNMITPPPTPVIDPVPKYFLEGETFTVNCSVNLISSLPIDLNMTIPGSMSKVKHETNENSMHEQTILYKHYIIEKASKNEAGKYICTSGNSNGKSSAIAEKIYLEKAFINMRKSNDKPVVEVKPKMSFVSLAVSMAQYPPTTLKFFKDSVLIDSNSKKVHQTIETYVDACQSKFSFNIHDLNIEDSGNYTLVATNQYISKNATFDIRIIRAPVTEFATSLEYFNFTKSTINTLSCKITGYPLPEVRWWFNDIEMKTVKRRDDLLTLYKVKSRIEMPVKQPGTVMCSAENVQGNANVSKKMIVYEIGKGLGIRQTTTWFSEGDPVVIECLASIYEFVNVTWYGPDINEVNIVDFSNNTMSLYAVLRIDKISVDQAGTYACVGVRNDYTEDSDRITIDVEEAHEPVFEGPGDVDLGVLLFQPINLTCLVDSVPPPHIEWYKDGIKLPKDGKINEFWFNKTQVESNVTLKNIEEDEFGKYECRVTYSRYKDMEETFSKSYNIILTEKPSNKNIYFSVLGVIFLLLIILVVYLTWKIKKEKRFRKELAAAGLLNFKEGATKSLNPDLGIDEQAELLPYDEKFEFSASRLILGKQLGAGAFGVVYKAEARGIVNAEETTIVAVKMVKKTADNMYIKALASELKIMVHLGKHVNIVNLLGACTKNVGKRELIVIVEYCKYGNIHNYMMKHREVFIDQLNDNPEKSMGKVNRGYSCSSANSGTHSDYFGMNHTQNTDNTFLNSGNTNRSSRKENQKQVEFVKASETGYVQPEWRSNYESDYSFDGRTPRPLCSRDLLAWAFQIARGMEYLASRKVLHGDLAARNILLADDNVVKICDFGLARNIYNNDEYQKKENSPLPVKWLAIECMTDRIFSTQSDVWSFGIVLWELFSLAKTPYPNVTPPTLLQWLTEGRRLERPQYADEKLYDVMLRCWDQKPTARPTFSQLQQTLGSFLEDNVRNHYVDLNMSYMDMNVQRDGEDYLAMVTAPDYNNMVTPSPHHYVNEANFFPPTPNPQQLQHDDEGYLQMSPATRQNVFNARAQGTKFDFDARKLAPRAADASTYGSELTPMLTLNNLARSGSESDHEPHSPYMNMCPPIEEEADADEVFDPAANNARNQRPTAVTNPTYITFAGDQKQPLANSYININVPNGLVK